jgi:hypothetical protein
VAGETYHAFVFLVIFSATLRCNIKDHPEMLFDDYWK